MRNLTASPRRRVQSCCRLIPSSPLPREDAGPEEDDEEDDDENMTEGDEEEAVDDEEEHAITRLS
jgi:hypothetical protein